jgi:hypothetical protein
MYHAFRLIFEIERMLEGKEPKIFWENEEREFLLNVRNEKKSKNEYLHEIKPKMENIEKIEKKLNQYFEVDVIKKGTKPFLILNDWLIDFRMNQIKNDEDLKKFIS